MKLHCFEPVNDTFPAGGNWDLGSDITIHGNTVSIGCLAMGDEAAQDLFVLAALTGVEKVSVVLSPVDFRISGLPNDATLTSHSVPQLCESIRPDLNRLGAPGG